MTSEAISAPSEGGIAYLDRWRAMQRPVPGSVPHEAGFEPTVPVPEFDDDLPAGGTPEPVTDLVQRAVAAIERLGDVDLLNTEVDALGALVSGTEQIRRMSNALATEVAGTIEHRNPFRSQGYLSAKTFLKQRVQLSGPEAHRRAQTARMHDRLPEWAGAARTGTVGVAQSELMGRVAANPRIEAPVLQRDAGLLLDDARTLPYDEFERRLRMWEALADPTGDDLRHEQLRSRRSVDPHARPNGGWAITGELPEPDGVEFAEIFAAFVDAEWRADWTDARSRLGDDATQAGLRRSEAQRRADALLAMARAAIDHGTSGASGTSRPKATVNILFDEHSMEERLAGIAPDPRRYRNVVCRTQSGRRLHPDDAIETMLTAHIRRVVYDSSGTIIDLGRRSRLFRGSSCDAVMLMLATCIWIGCNRPVAWCEADHSLAWAAHGATVPRNGQPLCNGHHDLKETGFSVGRDSRGNWHITDPDGNDVT